MLLNGNVVTLVVEPVQVTVVQIISLPLEPGGVLGICDQETLSEWVFVCPLHTMSFT